MKAVAIILGLLAVLFAYLFFGKTAAVTAAASQVATNQIVLTNALRKFETELMLTNQIASELRSNLQSLVDIRTAHLNVFSNRLVQANLLLQTAEEAQRKAQTELQVLAASNAVLVLRGEEADEASALATRLEAQLVSERRRGFTNAMARDSVAVQLQSLSLEYAELARRLDDVTFLRTQLEKAEEAAALRKQAAVRPLKPTDRRLPIALQPDGTVRPVTLSKP